MNDKYIPYWGVFVDEDCDIFHLDAIALSKQDFVEKTEKMHGKKIMKHQISFLKDGEITIYGWEKAHETPTDT